ncbi:non-hydrolyzing UDP-N-acetylglucosamine 2-epimerase [Candidatus Electrothrix sp.]|uniref:non-hydrolyzing UDP-N-acetylglucosamine 2-epimerase n=2 Tax=Candidatus Electrothrix sp. TaxID=2170559 RepID=UPI004055D1F7
MKIISVVGARPNFMKIAPFIHAINAHNGAADGETIDHILVHTGQHYDDCMSRSFFEDLNIPDADINLGIGSGSHAEQVGNTMIAFEKVLQQERPDWVVVVGDVNATCACSITAKKEHVKLAHIEAGLRSRDMTMPEEINRLVTDRLADLLLTPDRLSSENLLQEGVPEEKIRLVGNIMIDTLEAQRSRAEALDPYEIVSQALLPGQADLSPEQKRSVRENRFAAMTMHRPSNVDEQKVLTAILDFLMDEVAADMPLFWPVHPRAQKQMQTFGIWKRALACENLVLMNPLSYHELLRLNMGAQIMLTDSGGLQEECCVLGTPCLTLRWNTERPVTLRDHGGASVLVGNKIESIRNAYRDNVAADCRSTRPELWDGHTAERIVTELLK